jgi:hypothetical protein
MEIAWIQAIAYQPPVILGQQINPFSPFHALVLESTKSPYMFSVAPNFGDLVFAVHICGLRWETRSNIFLPRTDLRKWGKTQRKADRTKAMRDFSLYISESMKTPDVWTKPGKNTVKANGAYHLAIFAMRKLGMNEADAWNCPISRLICYRETDEEQETGKSDIITESEKIGMGKLKANNGAR